MQHNDLKINLKVLVMSFKACFGQGSVHNFVSRTTRDLINDTLLKNRLMKKKKDKHKENIPARFQGKGHISLNCFFIERHTVNICRIQK